VRVTLKERDYLDKEIKSGRFASYGQAFRGLLYYYKQSKRSIERMRGENAVLRAKNKELDAYVFEREHTPIPNVGE